MVAKIITGKSIRGALHYNENKVGQGQAGLLMASGFLADEKKMDFHQKLGRFQALTMQNKRTKTNTLHISLNFSNQDRLTPGLLKAVADRYMEGIGFGDQPYLVYRHFDAGHPHIHIVTTNIQNGGNRIETHNLGKFQSEVARKAIEKQYGLVKAEEQKKEEVYLLRPAALEKAAYGKSGTKAAISGIVREVVRSYRFTSLAELNAVLGQFNVRASRGAENTRMHQHKGLVYHICDESGNKLGVPIKASSIYSKPTLTKLEKKFERNKLLRKPHKERLRRVVDKILAPGDLTREQWAGELRKKGIRAVFRENTQGLIYGVTFIDNTSRSVFKGSDLGKSYSAGALMKRFSGRLHQSEKERPAERADVAPVEKITRHKGLLEGVLEELIGGEPEYEEYIPYELRKSRKRRKKKKD
ncbi:relaxase/mobilization nuclease domain-containing protein [Galbibacter sp. EGI 63066]|uniref:relaxase/mobilization nuclease domain-containing protein n=1 Tax=Galbibacter sp. EGI 63066 TaxID=2993559 RepID=UPI002249A26A|nr:relaxase/mobilization nuclease domain-containing protein [Galbibacter sp. EGI 63066]MCX2680965.1 relaxase/mobilization nuclease domain-containing protein [Galbibacter sp. EGI 63066]